MPNPDYASATFQPAAAGNYSQQGRPASTINKIIIHDIEGTAAVGIQVFADPRSQVSAHYVIDSTSGAVTQMVPEANTAYHCGNLRYNQTSIGIEHEGFAHNLAAAGLYYTETMYRASAALVRDIASRHPVPLDRAHILGHNEVPDPDHPGRFGGQNNHTDPGPYWDWEKFMTLVRGEEVSWTTLVRLDDSECVTTPANLIPANSWFLLPSNPEQFGSNLYTYTTANPGSSRNSALWLPELPENGIYEVYAFIPYFDNGHPDTTAAVYTISDGAGETSRVSLNQAASTGTGFPGWLSLGRYFFTQGRGAMVTVTDYSPDGGKSLWIGAMKFMTIV